jgi:hypothetical protein
MAMAPMFLALFSRTPVSLLLPLGRDTNSTPSSQVTVAKIKAHGQYFSAVTLMSSDFMNDPADGYVPFFFL